VRFFEYPLQAIEGQLDEMNEQNECCSIYPSYYKGNFSEANCTPPFQIFLEVF
jgi:hypothetical protein